MHQHEGICFFNPTRGCPVFDAQTTDVAANVKRLETMTPEELLKKIMCPACVCAAVAVANKGADSDEFISFDYKAALAAWNARQTEEFQAACENYCP